MEFIGLGGVTDDALARIVRQLRAAPILGGMSRWSWERDLANLYKEFGHDQRVNRCDGSAWTWRKANPQRLLQFFVRESKVFRELLEQRVVVKPPCLDAPWKIILYADEVVPGNVLNLDNKRKVVVFYFGFRELGRAALCFAAVDAERSRGRNVCLHSARLVHRLARIW